MPLKTQLDDPPALNLTSMIDVVFQLIVFFMVGTRFASVEHKIGVQVPQVKDVAQQSAAPPRHVIHVKREGAILLGPDRVTLEDLENRLAALRRSSRNLSVIVRGDGEGAFQHVAAVLAACRKAGITDLGISVRVAPGPHVATGVDGAAEAGVRR